MRQLAASRFATPQELLADGCACDLAALEDAVIGEILDDASDLVCAISGGRVGGREQVLLRPYARPGWTECSDDIPLFGVDPEVLQVRVDGDVLPSGDYRVARDGSGVTWLSRRSGCWPVWQYLDESDLSPGTFSVLLEHGVRIGYIERQACIELACEMAKEQLQKDNRLPVGARSATYQGVSIQLDERGQALREGHDNLPRVSRFLGKWTGSGRFQSGAWSPELSGGWTWMTESPTGS